MLINYLRLKTLSESSEIKFGVVFSQLTEDRKKKEAAKRQKLMSIKILKESISKNKNKAEKSDALKQVEQIEQSQYFQPQYGINCSI